MRNSPWNSFSSIRKLFNSKIVSLISVGNLVPFMKNQGMSDNVNHSMPSSEMVTRQSADRTKAEELLRKRFFYAPAFSIYGGVAGLYDYGPPGCALQTNILNLWRNHFILEENMLEMDTTVLTPFDALKTSGHVDRFTDYMVKDLKTGDFYRADHLISAHFKKVIMDKESSSELKDECEQLLAKLNDYNEFDIQNLINRFNLKSDSGNDLSSVVTFNLMFGADIGPTGHIKAFLRPETAQGHFVNFKRLLECNNGKMPFASAQIGRAFRNEISPRSGLLRVREFTMAEIEHYVHPERKEHLRFSEVSDSIILNLLPRTIQQNGSSQVIKISVGDAVKQKIIANETLGYFLARIFLFLKTIGISEDRLRFRQHMANEMAHYASDCWDAEILNSYGWIECVGCADRSCYDLSMHSQSTGETLVVRERLNTPQKQHVTRLIIDKKSIGTTFKKQSIDIVQALEALDISSLKGDITTIILPINGQNLQLEPGMAKVVDEEMTMYVNEYIPSVIEPSFGIGRILYSLLETSIWMRQEDEQRLVLSLPAIIAPIKCLIAPLSGHDDFVPFVGKLNKSLRQKGLSTIVDDSSTSIGKRYSRNDEIGIPFAMTVDFQTVKDETITLRERDSTSQIRIPINDAPETVLELVEGTIQWDRLVHKYGLFLHQNLD